jgi:adenylate cyclase
MSEFKFNPTIIDYSYSDKDTETIANGVKLFIAKAKPETLKDAIEKLNMDQLVQVFNEMEEYHQTPNYRTRLTLTDLYLKFLEPKDVSEKEGVNQVYQLVCEKLAMDWMNENSNNNKY